MSVRLLFLAYTALLFNFMVINVMVMILHRKNDEKSVWNRSHKNADYSECFFVLFDEVAKLDFNTILKILIFRQNLWMDALFWIRNIMVKPFGLQGDSISKYRSENLVIKKDERFAFFKITEIEDNELLLEGTDKHLVAWISLRREKVNSGQTLFISTWVKYYNLPGRIYFFIIRPFHVLIIKSKIRIIMNHLNNDSELL